MKVVSLPVTLLAFAFWSTGAFSQNLVVNPGFEQDPAVPIEWEISEPTNGASVEIESKDLHSGKSSIRLDQQTPVRLPDGANEAENLVKFLQENRAAGYAQISQKIPVQEGKSYDLSFWHKSSGLLSENTSDRKQGYVHFLVWVFWLDDLGQSIQGDNATKYRWVLNEGTDSPIWTESINDGVAYSSRLSGIACVAPAGARYASIRFQLTVAAPERTPKIWIDDVSFRDVSVR